MKEKLRELLHSKELKYVAIGFAVLMLITNPGRLEFYDLSVDTGLPSQDKYYNCILFSCGNEWGTDEGYVREIDGSLGYRIDSFHYKYIGIFYSFFIVSEDMKTHEKHFHFLSKP
ncbi:hypothetical protein [Sulfuricurvum sp.]|uniref:hypothetical protein n=1 Tax=Sulfuricurvum sp. TaxID=2025608 RepID=UPI002D4DA06C|nr:hypothetical protein [Sulfuricurvum sp.]HZF69400.1 hypothetical protein [Sulfuricurvum sp.]